MLISRDHPRRDAAGLHQLPPAGPRAQRPRGRRGAGPQRARPPGARPAQPGEPDGGDRPRPSTAPARTTSSSRPSTPTARTPGPTSTNVMRVRYCLDSSTTGGPEAGGPDADAGRGHAAAVPRGHQLPGHGLGRRPDDVAGQPHHQLLVRPHPPAVHLQRGDARRHLLDPRRPAGGHRDRQGRQGDRAVRPGCSCATRTAARPRRFTWSTNTEGAILNASASLDPEGGAAPLLLVRGHARLRWARA